MGTPVRPPVAPMLARLVRDLPRDGLRYEPKWDGFRCLAFRDAAEVELRSRHDRPLGRYFPEIRSAVRAIDRADFVLDGELLVERDGRADFDALLLRVHPAASRVARLAAATPARYVVFDLLARDCRDMRERPYGERRAALEELVSDARPAVALTPSVADPAVAARWADGDLAAGYDGVVAKPVDGQYESGRRGWWKVKPDRTADCVVAGFRVGDAGDMVSSLLLGLYDHAGALQHVGIVSSFARDDRRAMLLALMPCVTDLKDHPWREGFALEGGAAGRLAGAAGRWTPAMPRDWLPLRPELVCEVAYDRPDGLRFRHPARFRRWRPDRTPASCTVDQVTDGSWPAT
jgi:ATP-dependent DNA ligase